MFEEIAIAFRPHHFLCTLCFNGNGYNAKFTANYQEIVNRLQAPNGDTISVDVVAKTDSICKPCPHRQGSLCETQVKIDSLDTKHADLLNILPGMQLTWGEAKARISQVMTLSQFHRVCATCSWKSLGLCEAALRDFLANQ